MEGEQIFSFGSYRVDLEQGQLWRGTQLVKLTPKALAVLRVLASRPGQVVTKDDLFRAVWARTVVSDTALTSCIKELRQALRDDARKPRYLETIHRRGYRFIAPRSTASPVPSLKSQVQSPQPTPSLQHRAPTLVGREMELQRLHSWWDKALQGERQLVFVTGEPGIGKTTLVEAFLAQVVGGGAAWLGRGQCIEHYGAGEAYLPLLEALGRLCRSADGERVLAVLRKHAPMWLVQLPAFIDGEELELLQRKVQGASRERMLRELAEALEVLTAEQPFILWLEDLHWSDVSTLDWLAFLARRQEPARLLVIGTYRPMELLTEGHPLKGHVQELVAHQLCTELALGPLREADVEAYVVTRLSLPSPLMGEGQGEGEVPRFLHSLAHTLYHRTDGNPLFLVSLVDDLMAHGVLSHTADGWTVRQEADTIAVSIPESIRQLVARQRERLLPEEQHVLEAASVAGMEFSAAAVAAALATDTARVERHCEQLAGRQHFLKQLGVEEWPDGTLAARYTFLHALYQQLWHERVSPTQLQQHHLQIGERKERAYGERAREIAAELAIHFEQGREYQRAVQYHGQAAQHALQRSASQEATMHLTTGLTLLHTLPDTPERIQQELLLQISLGVALMTIKGYTAPGVEVAYARARALCQQLEDTPQLFPVLFGLLLFYSNRGELKPALELDRQLQHLAQRYQDPLLLAGSHNASGMLSFRQGEFASAQTSWERCLALYEPQQTPAHLSLYGQDPGVAVGVLIAFVYWLRGYPEQAVRQAQAALMLAHDLSHPYSEGIALLWAAHLDQVRREVQAAQARAGVLMSLAQEQGFEVGFVYGMIIQGWALAEQGQMEEGIAQIHEGLAAVRALGAEVGQTVFLAMLAEAHRKGGQAEEGLNVLAEALAMVERNGERYYEAELYRLKGELTLQKFQISSSNFPVANPQSRIPDLQVEAEACFLKALEIARRQQAKSLELRTGISLSRLWQQQNKKEEARQLLAEIYGWFTEGFDTADLKEAKVLLEKLEGKG